MKLLIEQLKKLTTFFIILIFLFLLNIFFNVNYQWDGISIIVRVYIFLLSFYMVSNIASLDVESLKKEYFGKNGFAGTLYLFFQIRLAPVIVIYLLTFLYGLVDHIGSFFWPGLPIVNLLNGGYANTVIYSVILLMILKMKRDPQVTIPVFLAVSVFYLLVLDKLVYIYFSDGMAVSLIKLVKYSLFFFFLFYEFFYKKNRLFHFALSGIISGVFIHGMVTMLLLLFVAFQPGDSYVYYHASRRLLKSGYYYHLKDFERNIIEYKYYNAVDDFLKYSKIYKNDIEYSSRDWQEVIENSSPATVDSLLQYLSTRSVELDYKFIVNYVIENINKKEGQLSQSENITHYAAQYLDKNREYLFQAIEKESRIVKVWGMRVVGVARDIKSMPWLIDKLSSFDTEDSVNAYGALKKITGIDPARGENLQANSPEVIARFRQFYQNYHKKPQ